MKKVAPYIKPQKPKGVLGQEYSTDRKKKLELKFRLSVRARIVADAIGRYSTNLTGLNVLDFGAAEGRTLSEINNLLPENEFIGVEYSKDLINSASMLPENISLLHGDVTKLSNRFSPASFDVASALAVLEHLAKPLTAVEEAYRVLKPGGVFVATSPVPAWDSISNKLGLQKEDHHEIELNRQLLIKTVKSAGFDLLEYSKFMWAPISFLPYMHIPVSAKFSLIIDRRIESIKIFNWLFVNQVVIGRKPF